MIRDRRRSALAAIALVALALMTACTPEPAPSPSPSPTGFASEDEAFAAAEATYRAYVDAANRVVLSDPRTFDPVYEHLTGEALSAAKKSFTRMGADGWKVGGTSRPTAVVPSAGTSRDSVELAICVDVSDVTLTDASGTSQVGERPTEQSLRAVIDRTSTGWLISSFTGRTGEPECAP